MNFQGVHQCVSIVPHFFCGLCIFRDTRQPVSDREWGYRPAHVWWVLLKAGALSLGGIPEPSCSRDLSALVAAERLKYGWDQNFVF